MTGVGTAVGGIPGSILGNTIGGLFSNWFGSSSQSQQYKYQKRLMQHQFDLQKQMFDYTSAYNSPVNAVQRYKDAGLNPNLLLGSPQMAGSTGSISSGQAGLRQVQSQADLAHHVQMTMINKKLGSDIALNESQAELNKYNAFLSFWKSLDAREKARFAPQMYQANLDLLGNQAIESKNRANYLNEQAITEQAKRLEIKASTMLKIAQGVSESIRPFEILQNIRKTGEDIKTAKFYRAYLTAAADELDGRAKLHASQVELNNSNKEINNIVKKIKEYESINWHTISEVELNKLVAETADILAGKAPYGVRPPLGFITKKYEIVR